jgi:hypothetical protein
MQCQNRDGAIRSDRAVDVVYFRDSSPDMASHREWLAADFL